MNENDINQPVRLNRRPNLRTPDLECNDLKRREDDERTGCGPGVSRNHGSESSSNSVFEV